MLASGEPSLEEYQALTRETHASSAPPSAFGRFRVVHQVGAGVLGPVFRGYDPETERTVAIKSFPLDVTPEQADKLAAELGRLAGLELNHPSIVAPIASGAEGSVAYLAEDYFVADSVDIALRQYGPAPVPDALRLVGQLAGALDFAAAAGAHHGALHPRDVLVAPREVRMTGIGVAAALERIGVRAPIRRPYSAPERIEGAEWGAPADVFSLAVIAHELLTGRKPSAAVDALQADVEAIAIPDRAVLSETFARAFATNPADRHPTALAFAAALKHALTGQPIEAADEPERARPRRRPRGAPMAPRPSPASGVAPAPDLAAASDMASAPDLAPASDMAPAPDLTHAPDVAPLSDVAPAPEMAPPPSAASASAYDETPSDAISSAPDIELPRPVAEGPPPSRDEPLAVHEELPAMASPPLDLPAQPELPEPPAMTLDDLDVRPAEGEPPFELRPLFGDEAPGTGALAAAALPDQEPPASDASLGAAPMQDLEAASPAVPPVAATTAYRRPQRARRPVSVASLLLMLAVGILLGLVGGYYFAVREQPGAGSPTTDQGATPAQTPAKAPAETVPSDTLVPPLDAASPAAAAGAGVPARDEARPSGVQGQSPVRGDRPAATKSRATSRSATSGSAARAPKTRPTRPGGSGRAAAPAERTRGQVFEGPLAIVSRPPGARVFFDGHPVGTTPMTLSKVTAGSHVVRLERDGYVPWSSAIQVVAGQQNRVTASLDQRSR